MPRHLPMIPGNAHTPLRHIPDGLMVNGNPCPLAATRIAVRVVGGLAIVATERSFRNAEQKSIEATLTMPVPVRATVVGLSAQIGERTVSAVAQRKQKARETYEDALDRGKAAVLHEELIRGVHQLSVANVAPGGEVKVRLVWAMPLAFHEASSLLLRIPTTIGDVFGRAPMSDADAPVHAAVRHQAEVEIVTDAGVTHTVLHGKPGTDGRVDLDAPIDIAFHGVPDGALLGTAADGRTVSLSITRAHDGRETIQGTVLLDRSGSMSEGDHGTTKHAASVRGLQAAAVHVRQGDQIALWEFENTANRVKGAASPIRSSGEWLRAVAALQETSGGTQLGGALKTLLENEAEGDVLIVTDGKSWELDVQELAGKGRRFHAVLVGHGSLDAHVGALVAATGGELFACDCTDVGSAIGRAMQAMRRTRVKRTPIAGAPKKTGDVISGMAIEAAWSKADGVPTSEDAAVLRAVGAVAAALAIPLMEEKKAGALAEAEGIVSHLTSLVLVDEAGEAQEGIPAQRKVPLSTPGAFSGSGARGMAVALSKGGAVQASAFYAAPSSGVLRSMRGAIAASAAPMMSAPRGGRGMSLSPSDAGGWTHESTRSAGPELFGDKGLGRGRPILDFGAIIPPGPVLPAPAPVPATVPTTSDLRLVADRINWGVDPEALRQGDLSRLPSDVAMAVLAAAGRAEVIALAAATGANVRSVVLALLALSVVGDRAAARLGRAVLGKADAGAVARCAQALGLAEAALAG